MRDATGDVERMACVILDNQVPNKVWEEIFQAGLTEVNQLIAAACRYVEADDEILIKGVTDGRKTAVATTILPLLRERLDDLMRKVWPDARKRSE